VTRRPARFAARPRPAGRLSRLADAHPRPRQPAAGRRPSHRPRARRNRSPPSQGDRDRRLGLRARAHPWPLGRLLALPPTVLPRRRPDFSAPRFSPRPTADCSQQRADPSGRRRRRRRSRTDPGPSQAQQVLPVSGARRPPGRRPRISDRRRPGRNADAAGTAGPPAGRCRVRDGRAQVPGTGSARGVEMRRRRRCGRDRRVRAHTERRALIAELPGTQVPGVLGMGARLGSFLLLSTGDRPPSPRSAPGLSGRASPTLVNGESGRCAGPGTGRTTRR
jgi:hypothetical protein